MWTDANNRKYAEYERAGDTLECADEEISKLRAAQRAGKTQTRRLLSATDTRPLSITELESNNAYLKAATHAGWPL